MLNLSTNPLGDSSSAWANRCVTVVTSKVYILQVSSFYFQHLAFMSPHIIWTTCITARQFGFILAQQSLIWATGKLNSMGLQALGHMIMIEDRYCNATHLIAYPKGCVACNSPRSRIPKLDLKECYAFLVKCGLSVFIVDHFLPITGKFAVYK